MVRAALIPCVFSRIRNPDGTETIIGDLSVEILKPENATALFVHKDLSETKTYKDYKHTKGPHSKPRVSVIDAKPNSLAIPVGFKTRAKGKKGFETMCVGIGKDKVKAKTRSAIAELKLRLSSGKYTHVVYSVNPDDNQIDVNLTQMSLGARTLVTHLITEAVRTYVLPTDEVFHMLTPPRKIFKLDVDAAPFASSKASVAMSSVAGYQVHEPAYAGYQMYAPSWYDPAFNGWCYQFPEAPV